MKSRPTFRRSRRRHLPIPIHRTAYATTLAVLCLTFSLPRNVCAQASGCISGTVTSAAHVAITDEYSSVNGHNRQSRSGLQPVFTDLEPSGPSQLPAGVQLKSHNPTYGELAPCPLVWCWVAFGTPALCRSERVASLLIREHIARGLTEK